MLTYRFTTLICMMLLIVTDAMSVEPNEAGEKVYQEEAFPQESIYDEPTPSESKLGILDKTHHYISEYVEKYVTDIDRFFANDALYKYTTDSYVQLSGDVLFEETGETGYGANLRARLDMPGTKKRFKLIFDTDPKEKQDPLERSVDDSPAAAVQECRLSWLGVVPR